MAKISIVSLSLLALLSSQGGALAFHPTGHYPSRRVSRRRTSTRLHLQQERSESLSRRQAFVRTAGAVATTSSGLVLPGVVQSARAADEGLATDTTPVPKVRLGKSSLEVSRTIQGCWQLAGGHGIYKEADAIENMRAHYKAGITTLDTADIYGPSESIVGKFVAEEMGAVPCTKFCCFRYLEDISREEVKQRIQRACERLQVSKLPLVQFFWSNYDVKRYVLWDT